jgi:translation initiation factor IF-3
LRPAVTFRVDLLVIQGFRKFRFQKKKKKKMLTKRNDGVVLTKNVNERFSWGDVTHNHDADSEARLKRQILNNSVKRKAILCERPRKLTHKELRSQYVDTLTYKDIKNISRNMHKARSSQLLPLPTDTEETHEALSAVQV